MRKSRESEERFEVPMTPLMDMMFILIIFFLVSTSFRNPERDQQVRLPDTSEGAPSSKVPDDIIVNVRQGGVLVVNQRIITIDELQKQLIEAARKNPKQIVKVRGDAMAYHKQVVRVLEACSKADIKNVSIVTRAKH
jgi:biopolymer transport protein ExbD